MSSASKTSSAPRTRKTPRRPKTYPFATSNTRGRKREARRWLDVLAARCTNGARNPNPLTIAELGRRWQQGMADLERQDKTLFDAVRQCNWDDMVAEEGITMEEWRKKALKSAARVGRIRAELRESGSI